jgi:hypothetical protein
MMTKQELETLYFDWMIHLIRNNRTHQYKKLLNLLNEIPFTYLVDMDENRYADGLELRYRFGENTGLDYYMVDSFLKNEQCSVLEMMVALSLRCEEQIMSNTEKGDRISIWFWDMIESLGLESMADRYFDEQYSRSIVTIFLNRDYARNGKGSLFTISQGGQDMRKVEIWYQACAYLNSVIAREER